MAERPADILEQRLADLGAVLAYPSGDPTLPGRVTARIAGAGVVAPRTTWWWRLPSTRPRARRGLVLAIVLLLVLAAVAAAVGLGLRGIRITLLPAGSDLPAVTTPSAASPSASRVVPLGIGQAVALADAAAKVGFVPLVPSRLRPPDAAFVAGERLTLVWWADEELPAVIGTDVGLLMTQLRGRVDQAYLEKLVDAGVTDVDPVLVDGAPGFWIEGGPHLLQVLDPAGRPIEDSRRLVDDTLLWERGPLTLRIESGLGRARAVELARSLQPLAE